MLQKDNVYLSEFWWSGGKLCRAGLCACLVALRYVWFLMVRGQAL